jgi:hypothetical protein
LEIAITTSPLSFLVATIVVKLQAQEGGASFKLVEERGEDLSPSFLLLPLL